MNKTRCSWVNLNNPLYVKYHDEEWGEPCHDDQKLFERFVLEMFQAGLSWECVLNKREAFLKSFDNFDIIKVSKYDEEKINILMNTTGIIRNKKKIISTINNAKVFRSIIKEYKTFDNYIWSFTDGKIIYESNLTKSKLSDIICEDLKKRGMIFIGSKIIYSFLQSIGVINAHEMGCYKKNVKKMKKI